MRRVFLALFVAASLMPAAAVRAQSATTTVYFAEGTTRPGFIEVLYFLNTSAGPIDVDLEFQFADGDDPVVRRVRVGPRSTLSLVPADDPEIGVGRDISVVATSPSFFSAARVVDFAAGFNGVGFALGTTASAGLSAPDRQWNLAEGSTLSGFQEYITVQNPGQLEALVTISYGLEGQPGPTTAARVPPRSRITVDVNSPAQAGPGQLGVSARIDSTQPVLVERPTYFNRDITGLGALVDGGHVAAGAQAEESWFFAEGNVLDGWYEFLTLYNPNGTAQVVKVDYLLESAPPQSREYVVPGGARKTIQVYTDGSEQGVGRNATTAASRGVSMIVSATGGGIVAERPLYASASFGGRPVDDGHVALGAPREQACAEFAVAFTFGDAASFLTLANISRDPVEVSIGVYKEDGTATYHFNTVPAESRFTVDLRRLLAGATFGVDVFALGGKTLVAEAPLYFAFDPESPEAGASVLSATPCM